MFSLTIGLCKLPRASLTARTSTARFASSLISNNAAATIKTEVVQHPAYDVIEKTLVSEYGVFAILYSHKKTGAQVMSVISNDENKVFGITFRTPPSDSTGVPHILEHSVLCGSRKFPVKEPFVDLLKGSLQNFLNAFTYPDRTCYPIASTNTKDFYNLIHVYLDAVLHPRAVSDSQVLQQEGWHYELENPSDPLTLKGVVYNEMKGVYSSPDSLLGRAAQQALFPENTYGVDSGGDPNKIPDLTFEQFKAFHSNYYHPSNSRVYFYGNDDPLVRLTLLDDYLREFDRIPVTSQIKYQPKNLKPSRLEVPFPVAPNQAAKPKQITTVNWLLNDAPLDPKETLSLSLLDSLLLGTSSSVLRKALTESKLGESVTGGGLSDELLQNTFSVGLKGVNEEDVPKVEELVLNVLTKLAANGFEEGDIQAALNTLEFRLREFNTGSYPRGLALMLGMLSNWIYDKPVVDGIRFEQPLEQLKNDLVAGKPVFQNLLKKYFVQNNHRVSIVMKPDPSLEETILKEEESKLAKVKESMSEDDVKRVIDATLKLKEAQLAEDSPEAKATLPRLGLEDIEKKVTELPIEIVRENVDGVTVLKHSVQSNGILYSEVAFDFSGVLDEDLPLLPLFSRMITEAGTATLDEVSLSRKIGSETGGIGTSYITDVKSTGGKVGNTDDVILYFVISGKSTAEKAGVMYDLFADTLLNVRLDNQKRALEMLKESKVRRETSVITSGHTFAATRLAAKFSFLGYLGEKMGGIEAVREASKLVHEAEHNWPVMQQRLQRIRDAIVKKGNVVVNLTGDDKTLAVTDKIVDSFLSRLPAPTSNGYNILKNWNAGKGKLLEKNNEGFAVPSQVNYVVKGGPILAPGERVPGSYNVVARYISTGYLWDNVRVLGGAYGGFARFSESSGRFVYMSYRDPNLIGTLNTYDAAAEHVLEADITSEDILQGIIGTIGDMDSPLTPDQKGYASFIQYLTKETAEERQNRRSEILSSSHQDFKTFAEKLRAIKDSGIVVTVGSASALDQGNNELGDGKKMKIEPAFGEIK